MLGGTKVTVTGTGFPMEADRIKVTTERINSEIGLHGNCTHFFAQSSVRAIKNCSFR